MRGKSRRVDFNRLSIRGGGDGGGVCAEAENSLNGREVVVVVEEDETSRFA